MTQITPIPNDTPLDFERLVEWLEGRLSNAEAQEVATQLASADAATQADAAWLRQFFDITRGLAPAEPPAELTKRLERRFTTFAQGRRSSPWQRFVATLSFDSHKTLAARGARAAGPGEQRQFLYETEYATVAFTLQHREQGRLFDLLGQFMPADESEVDLIRVYLLRDGVEFDSTVTDDLGEFFLPAVPRGQYDLVLDCLRYAIAIPSLDLSI
jgi:hypothetical protein